MADLPGVRELKHRTAADPYVYFSIIKNALMANVQKGCISSKYSIPFDSAQWDVRCL